jgi:hypothetical protein
MAEVAPNVHPEVRSGYWARSSQPVTSMPAPQATICKACNAEFLIGAQYCHACGAERGTLVRTAQMKNRLLDWTPIEEILGLSRLSLIAGVLGVLCLVVALAVGFLFRAATLVDWQAIQVWRIEWILGAAAFFLLGILLKKPR